jgi:copper/silver efflux system protein
MDAADYKQNKYASTGVRTDIGFKIFGENLDTLEVYAIKAEGLLKNVDGAADVVAERVQNGYYLDIQIKREIAARYGVNISDLQDIIETAIGGQNLGVVIEGRMRFPIRMRYQKDYRDDVEEIKSLIVPVSLSSPMNVQSTMNNNSSIGISNSSGGMSSMGSSNNAGVTTQPTSGQSGYSLLTTEQNAITYLPISELADVKVLTGPPMISSENGMLRSIVFMNTRGRDMGM